MLDATGIDGDRLRADRDYSARSELLAPEIELQDRHSRAPIPAPEIGSDRLRADRDYSARSELLKPKVG